MDFELLELLLDKQVNLLVVATYKNVSNYNRFITIYETHTNRTLTKKEFEKIKKAVNKYERTRNTKLAK